MRLYVAVSASDSTRYCPGSSLCMRIIQHLPLGTIQVLDCATVHPVPSWLTGTPTLDAGDDLYRGEDAVMKIVQMVVQHSNSAAQRREPPSRKTGGGAADSPNAVESLDDLWTETQPDEDDDDDELNGGRKLTSDDLSRAVRQQEDARQQPGTSAPPAAVTSLLKQEHD